MFSRNYFILKMLNALSAVKFQPTIKIKFTNFNDKVVDYSIEKLKLPGSIHFKEKLEEICNYHHHQTKNVVCNGFWSIVMSFRNEKMELPLKEPDTPPSWKWTKFII
jgi:hypothetical protein